MEQFAWTALGLLSASLLAMFGMFFYLGAKIDALAGRLDSRIDGISTRIDGISARLDALIDQFAAHIADHRSH